MSNQEQFTNEQKAGFIKTLREIILYKKGLLKLTQDEINQLEKEIDYWKENAEYASQEAVNAS